MTASWDWVGSEPEHIAEELRRGNPDFVVMWGVSSQRYWARHSHTEGWIGEQDPGELQRRMTEIRHAHQGPGRAAPR